MTKSKKIQINKKFFIIILFLIAITFLLNNVTFAKYISQTNSTASVDVAKFSFELKNNKTKLTDNFTYNLAGNITGGSGLSKSGICPGKSGQIDIIINMSGTEVATRYSIYMNNKNKIPSNLKFYSDSTYTTEINLGPTNIYTGNILLSDINTPVNKTIYWKWAWDPSTEENIYEGTEFLFDIKVIVSQITE